MKNYNGFTAATNFMTICAFAFKAHFNHRRTQLVL